MDLDIHFSEIVGIVAVFGGALAWAWFMRELYLRNRTQRRARALSQHFHRG
jgi:hypothetical protein